MKFRYVDGWGKLPPGYNYVEAAGVDVDAKDNVYVFCRGEHPVIVFDRDGNFLRSWGKGIVSQAHAITIGPDNEVWLTDSGNHTIRKFTNDGKLLLTIGDIDNPASLQSGKPFNRPTHVALCPHTGAIYISDGYGNSRIHKYDPAGRHLFSWGEGGTDPGCFNIPHNVVTDRHGLIYVADRENHRIQIFDSNGKYLDQFNNLHRPCGLCIDVRCEPMFYVGEFGTMYHGNAKTPNLGNRVSILDLQGGLAGRIGDTFGGEGPSQFVAPHSVKTDSQGAIYIAEVSYTVKGKFEDPPREIRSLQKYVPQ
jgi:DNA-binding beta-propeller fold protein YncE